MGKKHRQRKFINPIQHSQSAQSSSQIVSQSQSVSAQVQLYQGPLPAPEILRQYDQVVPGAAERIISMAEQQAKHRQNLESTVVLSDVKDSNTGLWLGFIIGIVAIISGAVCILQGHTIAGGVLGGSAVPGLTAVFVYGSRQRRKERETKFQLQAKDKDNK